MTRQTKTLMALIAALAVCAGAYAGLRLWNSGQEEGEDTVYLTQIVGPEVLSFTNQNGTCSFTKAGDGWQYDGDGAFPADQDALEDLAERAGTLTAIRVIDDPEPLSAYGLETPALQITVVGEGGERAALLLGDSTDSYCYAKEEHSDLVYTIDTSLAEELGELELLDLAAIPDLPDLGTDSVSSLTWRRNGTILTLTKAEESSSDSGEEAEPLWYVDGTAIPEGNSAFSSLFAQLSSLELESCWDYRGEADVLSACGLTEPVGVLCVKDGEEEVLTLTIGSLDGTGESYYVQRSGDPAVYLLPADSVTALVELTAEQLIEGEGESEAS